MKGIAGFLFDLDGVLVDTHRLVLDGWRDFGRLRGLEFDDAAIVERMFGRRTLDVLIDVFGITPDEAAAMIAAGVDDKRAEVAAGPPLEPIAGAPDFVRRAQATGLACAVVSSSSAVNIRLALEHIGLSDAFAVIVDHDRVAHGKPAPDGYLSAAAELRLSPAECVVFEDTAAGVRAGKAAGAWCVGVASIGRPDLLAEADVVVADFRALEPADLIRRLGGPAPR